MPSLVLAFAPEGVSDTKLYERGFAGARIGRRKPMGDDRMDETLSEEMIDETLAESFPASDPPSWTLGRERRRPSSGTENSPKAAETQTSRVDTKDKAGF
jgi:hypothetical protein